MSGGGWRELRSRLARLDFAAGRVLVGLDFDGTLADIVEAPRKAALSVATRRLLLALHDRPDTRLAVLSGRALSDVQRLVGLPDAFYAGNHGLEMEGPGLRWTHPSVEPVDPSVLGGFERGLLGIPGAEVEHKRLGVAVHYRRVKPKHVGRLRGRFTRLFTRLKDRFRLLRGKKTFDLRPKVSWDKGHALTTIRRGLPGGWMAVFVGDDHTDEEAFRTLGPRALTVRVGRVRKSAAEYIVPHRRFVDSMLESLALRSARA